MKKKSFGFTLIELMAVIGIIVLLIGLLFPALNTARRQANKQKAKSMIGAIEVAISMYYNDRGFYPAESGTSNSFNTSLAGEIDGYGPYIEFKQEDLSVNAALDPWGTPYRYDRSNPPNNSTFDLWSCGPNGVSGTNGSDADNITNW